jgi:hypothetical protein
VLAVTEVVVVTAGDVEELRVMTRMLRYSAGSVLPMVYCAEVSVPIVVPASAMDLGNRSPPNTMVKVPLGFCTTLGAYARPE